MPRCEIGEKLLERFRNNNSWENHKKFDKHTSECDICSGKFD